MDFSMQRIKGISQNVKHLVSGFIREAQALFALQNNKNPYYVIPVEISHICIVYYFSTEFFEICGKCMQLETSADTMWDITDKLKMTTGSFNTGYGHIVIDQNEAANLIYKWTIKCGADNILIGIDSSEYMMVNDEFTSKNNSHKYYGFYNGSDCNLWSHSMDFEHNGLPYGNKGGMNQSFDMDDIQSDDDVNWGITDAYSAGDVITMELNCKDKTLKYCVNEQDLGVAFKNIDLSVKYRLAVSISGKGYFAQIKEFEMITVK